MIHVSLKVNCTGCSAETACSLPMHLDMFQFQCDRTRANRRHFPLAFVLQQLFQSRLLAKAMANGAGS